MLNKILFDTISIIQIFYFIYSDTLFCEHSLQKYDKFPKIVRLTYLKIGYYHWLGLA